MRDALQSSILRNPNTPCFRRSPVSRTPWIGGINARLPVAIKSLSFSDSCFGGDDLGRPIDFDDRRAGVKHDVVRTVPVEWVDENLTGVLRAAQDAGKQDPVIVPIGFVANIAMSN